MTNAEEIKKRLEEIHLKSYTITSSNGLNLLRDDMNWIADQLRASLEREEEWKALAADSSDEKSQNYEEACKERDEAVKARVFYDRWLSNGVYFTTEEFKKYIEERDNLINLRKQDIELLHKTQNERDDYREVLEKFTEDYTSMNKRQEAKDVLDKYPKASK